MGTEAGYLGKVSLGTDMVAELGQWNITGQENDLLNDTQFEDTLKSFVPGRGDGGIVNFSGNYDPTDTNGQIALRTLYQTQAATNELRLYFGSGVNEFWFCEDETICLMQSLDDVGTDKSGLGKIGFSLKVSNGYMKRAVGSWDSSASYKVDFADAGYTITKDGGTTSFVTLGFTVGQVLTVRGSASNDGRYIILIVAADVLTVNEALTLEENLETGRFISIDYTLGDEVLSNDDRLFGAGVGSWAGQSGGAVAAVSDWSGTGGNGLMEITMEAGGAGGTCGAILTTQLTIGYTYFCSIETKRTAGDSIGFDMGSASVAIPRMWEHSPSGSNVVHTGAFKADGVDLTLLSWNTESQEFIVDNLSVKRIIY